MKINVNCPHCSHSFKTRFNEERNKTEQAKVTCPSCQKSSFLKKGGDNYYLGLLPITEKSNNSSESSGSIVKTIGKSFVGIIVFLALLPTALEILGVASDYVSKEEPIYRASVQKETPVVIKNVNPETVTSGLLRNGLGEEVFYNGSKYVGNYIDGNRTGKGVLTSKNGDVYTGGFLNGQKHGEGEMIFSNGSTYFGSYAYGDKSGKGRMSWFYGDTYTGDWVENKQTGKGVIEWNSGGKYSGEFEEDNLTGVGTLQFKDGSSCEGRYESGRLVGMGFAIEDYSFCYRYKENKSINNIEMDRAILKDMLTPDILDKSLPKLQTFVNSDKFASRIDEVLEEDEAKQEKRRLHNIARKKRESG